jgi:hypothetical protein
MSAEAAKFRNHLVSTRQAIPPPSAVDAQLPAPNPVHAARPFNRPLGTCSDFAGTRGHPCNPHLARACSSLRGSRDKGVTEGRRRYMNGLRRIATRVLGICRLSQNCSELSISFEIVDSREWMDMRSTSMRTDRESMAASTATAGVEGWRFSVRLLRATQRWSRVLRRSSRSRCPAASRSTMRRCVRSAGRCGGCDRTGPAVCPWVP